MAFSKIEIQFLFIPAISEDSILFTFDPNTGVPISVDEAIVTVRGSAGEVTFGSSIAEAMANFIAAFNADFPGYGFQASVTASDTVTIQATQDGFEFADFSSPDNNFATATITNVPYTPVFSVSLDSLSAAASPCADIVVTLAAANGTSPYEWITPLPATVGLVGTLPRSGSTVPITIEDDNSDQASVNVYIPAPLTTAAIDDIVVQSYPSGLEGSVTVYTNAITGLTYTYSIDGVNFQSSNVFPNVLEGDYTLYLADQYGCVVSQPFTVTLVLERLPAYRSVPLSNSFLFIEQQSTPNQVNVFYNGRNIQPNDYTLPRFNNPPYYQPWHNSDTVKTQFRSNYDQLSARLIDLSDESEAKTMTIVQKSENLGQREIMDAVVYDRGDGKSGVYFLTGDYYDEFDNTTGSYSLNGSLPDWAVLGQSFTISGTTANGLYQIKQIVFDSTLFVNVLVIDRIHTDANPSVMGVVDAIYNVVNYEVYEFDTDFSDVNEGCYRVEILMSDSLAEYQNSFWDSAPIYVSTNVTDHVYFESSDHPDDGIDYSTGIVHKQRVTGLFFDEDYRLNGELHKDSRNKTIRLDGSTSKYFQFHLEDVPQWVLEKLSLFINKKLVKANGVEVQTDESFERGRSELYQRVSGYINLQVVNYEQYFTNNFDIDGDRGKLLIETGFLKL